MNLAEENDVTKLKALAYDELVALERAQQNLTVLNKRIAEVVEEQQGEAS